MLEKRIKAAAAAIEKESNQWLEPDEVASMGIPKSMTRDMARAALKAADDIVKQAKFKKEYPCSFNQEDARARRG